MTTQSLTGKICIVTGGTAGIGEVTARELAHHGATVVIIARSAERGAATVERIQAATGNPQVAFLQADLSAREQTFQVAEQFKQRYDRLDVLVNNAGAAYSQRQESPDGIEMTFALNHLSYYRLTNQLLDILKASAPARVVNVSSRAHQGVRMNFDDLEGKQGYQGWAAYGQSKLANLLFTYELARRLAGTGVSANALHPGFVASNFNRNNNDLFAKGFRLLQLFAITPEEGAQTSIYLASSPEVEGVSGKYFDRCKPIRSSAASYNVADAQRLWNLSVQYDQIQH
jgi:NAD(P)-dependent dehydrogenase (short-subunit alcohol dehydrogenase family)